MENKDLLILTVKARADKAISTLKGILSGIALDKEINQVEIQELNLWVQNHNDLIRRNPFNEFMNIISEMTQDNIPQIEVIEDLFWLCQKYESDNYFYNIVTSDLQILQGICHGILSDGEINELEIIELNNWLSENEHLNTYYPYDELRSILLSIISDKKIDNEEKLILKAYFKEFVKITNEQIENKLNNEVSEVNIQGLCTSDPVVEFAGKTFCISGILKRGSRQDIEFEIIKHGGIPVNNISKKTDYLIIGDNGNPAWAFACYGRKVEKALGLRKEGHTIVLIHEYDFSDIIDDLR
jgi:hypothetical protein